MESKHLVFHLMSTASMSGFFLNIDLVMLSVRALNCCLQYKRLFLGCLSFGCYLKRSNMYL